MIRGQINDALKEAMRAKDQAAISTIRLILAAVKDRDIAARTKGQADGLSDPDLLALLQTMIRQRRDSIAMYEQGGRCELAEREQTEIDVIERFLPRQMDDKQAADAIAGVIRETGASSIKDMGAVMAALRTRFAGQMDFGKASGVVKQQLCN